MGTELGSTSWRFGDYELLRLLGKGTAAEVYEARRLGPCGFRKRLALKRLLPQLASDPRVVRRFCTEARIQASLNHPNLVQVIDFGEQDGELFMAMELVDGMSCADLLAAVSARHRAVAVGPALYIASEVLRALVHIHAACDSRGNSLGLIHRDVAPANILIGSSGVVKLADFGFLSGSGLEGCTGPGELRGKLGYVSPEQAMGHRVDQRSDLFSLAVVLSELLIGGPLFGGQNELEILANLYAGNLSRLDSQQARIPPDVVGLLRQALATAPGARVSTAAELLEAIGKARQSHASGFGAHTLVDWLVQLGLLSVSTGIRCKGQSLDTAGPGAGSADTAAESPKPAEVLVGCPTVPETPQAGKASPLLQATAAASEIAYRVRRSAELVIGPLSLAKLLEMIATGRVGLETEVSRDAGPFLPVSSVVELSRLAARSTYRLLEQKHLPISERYEILPGFLPAQLFRLAHQQRTGLLCARHGPDQKHVYFVEGCPVFTASTHASELLGERLAAAGVLNTATLQVVLEVGWRHGQPLGETLVAQGFLRHQQLRAALAAQHRARVQSLCRWSQGEVLFFERVASGEAELPAAAGLPAVTRAILGAYTVDQLAWLLAKVRKGRLYRSNGAELLSRSLGLDDAEARVLAEADRSENVDALVRRMSRDAVATPQTALSTVLVGLVSGALLSDAWPSL